MIKKAIIRVDGAPFMGIGHIMRCLTLATALKKEGWTVSFISRNFENNYTSTIEENGFDLHRLPHPYTPPQSALQKDKTPPHADWLGTSWQIDVQDTLSILSGMEKQDLLVIDHYAIDHRWQEKMRAHIPSILVIDDLADRKHDCNILLDQTFGRNEQDYTALVPKECRILCGSEYMILRDIFSERREEALQKRKSIKAPISNIFIAMGSADPDNITALILDALEPLIPALNISIILSSKAPYLKEIKKKAENSYHKIKILEDYPNVEDEMIKADIAFGAGGTMSWERCCLGLPTLLVVIADNQEIIAKNLEKEGAVICLGRKEDLTPSTIQKQFMALASNPRKITSMSEKAASICDGRGVHKTMGIIICDGVALTP